MIKFQVMDFHNECKMFRDKADDKEVMKFVDEVRKEDWHNGRGKDR